MASVASAAGPASAPYCGITWGSRDKTANPSTSPRLVNVRAGRHDCFDRLVLDVRGGNVTGYWVRYVATMTEDASGRVVPLRGGAKLSITAQAPAYDAAGRATYRVANRAELVNVAGFRTFRQVAWAGSFEGTTSVGLGVRARLPFRVFTLPGRLVVDVAHLW
ncbi:AMIN-like domain-containing (lipo)protein [Actinophytocola sp.]|uniref:AMIN-like domain-containing (lipo)protein n=1 Tax=Actinophytocola sp. TaxID=1872138 RepID=UPI003D6A829E